MMSERFDFDYVFESLLCIFLLMAIVFVMVMTIKLVLV